MSRPSSSHESPDALARDPELASLEILACVADTARRALFAEYPDLACELFVEDPDASARQCLALAVLGHLDSLADSIAVYRAHLGNLASASLRRLPDNDF